MIWKVAMNSPQVMIIRGGTSVGKICAFVLIGTETVTICRLSLSTAQQ